MKAIPTSYKGINFRSRLEARWAAFFDLRNQYEVNHTPKSITIGTKVEPLFPWLLPWEYEPLDFEGWIPDFVVDMHGFLQLCEVKPIYKIEEFQSTTEWNSIIRALDGGKHLKFPYETLVILGVNPKASWVFVGPRLWRFDGFTGIDKPDLWIEAGNIVQWRAPTVRR